MSVYRLYSFTNYYLSSLQKGLQTAHVVSEMALLNTIYREKHPRRPFADEGNAFEQWCRQDRTIIILNGGNSKQLETLYYDLQKFNLPYKPTFFREDEDSLGGAFTAVGILVPSLYWKSEDNEKWDHEEVVRVRQFLGKFQLAV